MIIILMAAVILAGIKLAPKKSFFENSFSIDQTRALKGLFAIVVMFHHLYGYLVWHFQSLQYFKNLGYLMVGGFFLISGYGLMYGVMKKQNYLKGFFRKRILSLIVPYYIIVAVYIAMKYYSIGNNDVFKLYVKESLLGLQLWFVPVMVLLYVLFRIAFIGYGKMKCKIISPIILTVLTAVYIAAFFITQQMKINVLYGSVWMDTAMCFVVGMWYCILKDKITPFLQKYYYVITALSLIAFALLFHKVCMIPEGYEWPTKITTLLYKELSAIMFCFVTLLLSMKIHIGNKVLNVCGDHSFEIYLSHAIFITLFRWGTISLSLGSFKFEYLLNIESNDFYMTAIIVGTFVFSIIVHKLCGLILKPIQRSVKK